MFDAEFVAWFWAKVDKSEGPDGCWYYGQTTGPSNSARTCYAVVHYRGRNVGTAHKIACTLAHGPVPDNQVVMHLCDRPPCCNPAHLKAGTYKENSQDALRKGRLWTNRERYSRD